MSHHYSGPNIGFPRGDARLDLTDLYAFPKPGDAGKSIFIMNVHPSVGLKPPGPTTNEPFASHARYLLELDTNADTHSDLTYEVQFSAFEGGKQSATLRLTGNRTAAGKDSGTSEVIVTGVTVSTGDQAHVAQGGDHRFFAGWRSDPFFFDVLGVLNNFQFTTGDFFADKDICSIALEVPNSILGSKEVGVWARTLIPTDRDGSGWIQADRGARPNQTPFLAGEQNDAYLAGKPAGDARFVPVFAHALEHTGGYSPAEAKEQAEKLLPDVLRYDPKRPASFPDNGRALIDDVSDVFLAILTNGKVTGDNVGPHEDFLSEFPYLGAPHVMRGN